MFPVFASFLPPTHIHLYLPTLLALSRAFNSTIIDERILELAGDLSEEHVSGAAGPAGAEGSAKWKDIGIWSESDWNFLVGKGLTSMGSCVLSIDTITFLILLADVPVGTNRVCPYHSACGSFFTSYRMHPQPPHTPIISKSGP